MPLNLNTLMNAIKALDDSIGFYKNSSLMQNLDPAQKNVIRSGVIQNFEVTYEQCWKFLKKFLETELPGEFVDGIHRKELYRIAAEQHLISNVEPWFEYHKARNLTSHTYNEEYAESVAKTAEQFLDDARRLLSAIEARND